MRAGRIFTKEGQNIQSLIIMTTTIRKIITINEWFALQKETKIKIIQKKKK